MLFGGSRFELSNRPMDETSPSVARVVLSPFFGRIKGDNELPGSEIGGEPRGHRVATFSPKPLGSTLLQGIFIP